MNHPLAEDYKTLSDVELGNKLDALNRKYWMTNNEQVRSQMVMIIDELRLEAERRRRDQVATQGTQLADE